jgi:hypothetical protein
MVTRNSPLPILRRLRKLPRRHLAIASVGNPLIFRNTFTLHYVSQFLLPLPPLPLWSLGNAKSKRKKGKGVTSKMSK